MRLLVAATGGHLAELSILAHRLRPVDEDTLWITSSSPQSRSLLDGERVHFVSEVAPRDWRAVMGNLRDASRLVDGSAMSVVSTGSGIALSYLPLARARGVPAHYIECAARVDSLSVTGRMLELVPGVKRYVQYPQLARGNWAYAGSVFDGFQARRRRRRRDLTSVVVTVGTVGFPFLRLFERLRKVLPAELRLIVQAGPDCDRLVWPDADVRDAMPASDLEHEMRDADLVIAHAGVGSALAALRAGKVPILLPRRVLHGEHVDDHQGEIARHLSGRGLAVSAEVDSMGAAEIDAALQLEVIDTDADHVFQLS